MQPSDSPEIVNLNTDLGGDLTTRFLIDPYTAITAGTEYRTIGVVVETAGYEGLVGMGTARLSRVQYNGQMLPLAFLDNLKVRAEFSGQGLGYQIADWSIERAREMSGEKCIIATGMLQDNHASRGVAKKWCREFIGPMNTLIMPVRSQAPKSLPGITVREIEAHEYEDFAVRQNDFYKGYNLYMPGDANSIAKLLDISPDGKKPYRLFVAVNTAGNLLAGAQTWFRGILKCDTINRPPMPLRILNSVLQFMPTDFVIRDAVVAGLWYDPNQLHIAQYLWEMIRWLSRDQATTIAVGFDPRDPAQEVVTLNPWHQPRPRIAVAILGPTPFDHDKLIFSLGRV